MSRIVIDTEMEQQLKTLDRPAELVNTAGNLVGIFTPVIERGPEPSISDEEIRRRIEKGGGRKLSEILADLEKRQCL